MKWLQDNPLGLALLSLGGVLTLLALAMAFVWSMPVAIEISDIEAQETGEGDAVRVFEPHV